MRGWLPCLLAGLLPCSSQPFGAQTCPSETDTATAVRARPRSPGATGGRPGAGPLAGRGSGRRRGRGGRTDRRQWTLPSLWDSAADLDLGVGPRRLPFRSRAGATSCRAAWRARGDPSAGTSGRPGCVLRPLRTAGGPGRWSAGAGSRSAARGTASNAGDEPGRELCPLIGCRRAPTPCTWSTWPTPPYYGHRPSGAVPAPSDADSGSGRAYPRRGNRGLRADSDMDASAGGPPRADGAGRRPLYHAERDQRPGGAAAQLSPPERSGRPH